MPSNVFASRSRQLANCLRRCRQLGVQLTRNVLLVNVAAQTVSSFEKASESLCLRRKFRCSTSRFGIGQREGSNCTPLGLHRVARKIGGGWPVGTVFKHRKPIGFTWQGMPDAKIATRILWLDGLEPALRTWLEQEAARYRPPGSSNDSAARCRAR